MYWRALQIGKPPTLSHDEMDRVVANFTDCGRAAPSLDA
jgi:hypothetical protein